MQYKISAIALALAAVAVKAQTATISASRSLETSPEPSMDIGAVSDEINPKIVSLAAKEAAKDAPAATELASVYGKYYSVSGFKSFQSAAIAKGVKYISTQTFFPSGRGFPEVSNQAQAFADPRVQEFASQVVSVATEFVATETFLPKAAKTSLVADFQAVVADELADESDKGSDDSGTSAKDSVSNDNNTTTEINGDGESGAAGRGAVLFSAMGVAAIVGAVFVL